MAYASVAFVFAIAIPGLGMWENPFKSHGY
jgi:hypothetical protein